MIADMNSAEPELHYQTTHSTKQTQISVYTSSTRTLFMSVWTTKTTVCWTARDTEGASSTEGIVYDYFGTYGAGASAAANKEGCKAYTVSKSTPGAGWSRSYPTPAGH
jgi:hypothetical protein